MYANISCVILSGGKSSRMGQNKALMKIGNQSLIEIMYGKVKGLFREILISSNSPHEYSFLNIPIVPDLVQNKGPIAGIYSGLKSAKNDRVFFISCDIPLMTPELIKS
ncbi:MAG: molybdenum cofactor guanylyltransferase, partial [Candidatus Brocadiae bacterium]|nr:molybdenum cofactor guanylyltransferase [Candidatus Brocadiia bacterium]